MKRRLWASQRWSSLACFGIAVGHSSVGRGYERVFRSIVANISSNISNRIRSSNNSKSSSRGYVYVYRIQVRGGFASRGAPKSIVCSGLPRNHAYFWNHIDAAEKSHRCSRPKSKTFGRPLLASFLSTLFWTRWCNSETAWSQSIYRAHQKYLYFFHDSAFKLFSSLTETLTWKINSFF